MSSTQKNWLTFKNRKYLKSLLPLQHPIAMQIEPSRMCNLKCIYCDHFNENEADNRQFLNAESFRRFIQESKKGGFKAQTVTFSGSGEPLLNKDLAEIISLTGEIATETVLNTNGLLLTPERIDEILASGVNIIRISLQGVTGEDYFNNCGKKIDFDKFLSAMKYLYGHKKQCRVVHKMPDLALDTEEKKALFTKLFEDKADFLTIQHIAPFMNSVDYDKLGVGSVEKNVYQDSVLNAKVCPQPFYTIYIGASGNIYPCCWSSEYPLGSIDKGDAVAIWDSEKMRKYRVGQLQQSIPHCKGCLYLKYYMNSYDYLDDAVEELLPKFET